MGTEFRLKTPLYIDGSDRDALMALLITTFENWEQQNKGTKTTLKTQAYEEPY